MEQNYLWRDPSHTCSSGSGKMGSYDAPSRMPWFDHRTLLGQNLARENWQPGVSKMSILDELATALGRRDEVPNQELARRIVRERNAEAVQELVDNLAHKDRGIRSDCIKTLYEIGAVNPDLIAKYYREFGQLLEGKNNRLVWGAIMALDTITLKEPKGVHRMLARILKAVDTSGSVIARDHAVGILAKLAMLKPYRRDCGALMIEQLLGCPNNQFPMYAEKCVPVIDAHNRTKFRQAIETRASQLDTESQKKRVARVLRKLT